MRQAALGVQQVAAIAVHRERDHRIGETFPVPVEIEEGVGEGVRHRMVQRLVGVGHVNAALDQTGGEVLGRLAMAVQPQGPIGRLVPAVRLAAVSVMPRLQLEIGVVAQQAIGRDDVLAEILVLIVTPHHHDIRVEVVEDLADRTKVVAKALAAAVGGGEAVVIAELGEQFGRPIGRILARGLDIRRAQRGLEHTRQPFVRLAQGRPVGDAETQYFRHLPVPSR